MIDVTLIRPGTKVTNDRTKFAEGPLAELAASIASPHGLVEPLILRPLDKRHKSHRYELVAGERRFRAITQILGMTEIPDDWAVIRPMSDRQAADSMMAENTSREDLSPIEEANAYQRRVEQFGMTPAEIADVAGVSVEKVRGRISLLSLDEKIQELVDNGQMPIGHAELLTGLDNEIQLAAARVLAAKPVMSIAGFGAVISELVLAASTPLFDLDAWTEDAAERVQHKGVSGQKVAVELDLPDASHLPTPAFTKGQSTGDLLYGYCLALSEAGLHSEAAAVGAAYRALVHHRKCNVAAPLYCR